MLEFVFYIMDLARFGLCKQMLNYVQNEYLSERFCRYSASGCIEELYLTGWSGWQKLEVLNGSPDNKIRKLNMHFQATF